MDEDTAPLNELFARVDATPDNGLAPLFETIAAALSARFAREEKLAAEARAPVLLALIELHQQLLNEVERMREAVAEAEPQCARQLIGTLPSLLLRQHLAFARALRSRDG